ncbi:VWA domain-containing protein, partial [Candidatus Bathyarchaeota archaeon]|nr:VWA domain-containing protein [Candidatus Bathyarchaeota archaeon]
MKNLVVCLDVSESMGYGSPQKLKQAVDIAIKAVKPLEAATSIGLVIFDSEPEVLLEPKPTTVAEVRGLLEKLKPRGVSRLAAGLEKSTSLAGVGGEVLAISDGRANLTLDRSVSFEGKVEIEQELVAIAKKAAEQSLKIHTVAVGEDAFTNTLKTLSKETAGFFSLAETFQGLNVNPKNLHTTLTVGNLTVYPAPAELPQSQPTWTRESQLTHVAVTSDIVYRVYQEARIAFLRNPRNSREARVAILTVDF